ncbi:MAG TPA: NAD(P)/FAD-dependent oxidoreductase [Euzebyales bacterium]
MTSKMHERDLLIIGAGPAGLYAAYYAGFRGMSVAFSTRGRSAPRRTPGTGRGAA